MESWAPNPEQEHNLQLLELLAKLREALLGIPSLITPRETVVVGVGVGCNELVEEAVNAIDKTVSTSILEPYLSGVSRSLEDIISKMHR